VPSAPHRFDAAYYARHYRGRSRVHSAAEVARLCTAVTGYADWLGLPLRRVLDVGAGPGLWRDWFARERPAVRYRSVDLSRYACDRFGHERRDIARWRARTRFDLVVCQGVLQYLPDADAARAIGNLAAMCGGLLYLEALTRRDLREVADPARSDVAVHARSGAWYRARLGRHFRQVGAGLWAARRSGIVFWELEVPSAGT
jgi:SAM-dependent methyltransferase